MKIIDQGNRIGFEIEEGDDPEVLQWLGDLFKASHNEDAAAYLAVVEKMMTREEFADVARRMLSVLEIQPLH